MKIRIGAELERVGNRVDFKRTPSDDELRAELTRADT